MRKNHSKYSNIIPKNQFFRVLFGIKNQTIVFQESPFFKGECFLDKEQVLFICSVANIQIQKQFYGIFL
ncbi:hypothetical protein HpHA50_03960 [Helicobacter pylori]